MINSNGRTLAAALTELKDDLREFFETRLEMLVSETKQKLATWKMAVPMFLAALVLGAIALLLLSVALVAALALLLGWGWSFLIVGAIYLLIAGSMAFLSYREIKAVGMTPRRTLNVLKQDQAWLQTEARTQL